MKISEEYLCKMLLKHSLSWDGTTLLIEEKPEVHEWIGEFIQISVKELRKQEKKKTDGE